MAFLKPTKGLRAALALACAFVLTACFDIEHRVKIDGKGAGEILLTITSEQLLDEEVQFETLIESDDGETEVRQYVEDGKLVHEQFVEFDSINSLKLADQEMDVTVRDRMLWGFGPTRATFTHRLIADDDDEDTDVLLGFFEERTYTFSVTLPGIIEGVEPVMLDGIEVEPDRQGNTLTWVIPMNALLSADDVVFQVNFIGFFKFEDEAQNEVVEGGLGQYMQMVQ